MLARTNILKHPSGQEIQTPILVSSFSSKGFRFIQKGKKLKSEVFDLIKHTSEYLSETVLLSAYDVKYYYPKMNKFRETSFFPRLIFLDSGGYETLEDYDFSESYKHPIIKQEWSAQLHSEVINTWPEYYPAVLISYDNGNERKKSIKDQIERAGKLFQHHRNQLNDFLIKPERKGELLNVQDVINNVSLLKRFDIIGLTEKELGSSIMQRMENIKLIRTALDNVGSLSPIHVFGSLDPLTSVLYFIAGAEIFDGLTWLRFSFYEGKCIYLQNCDALKNRVHEKDYLNYRTTLVENLIYLRQLQAEMKTFAKAIKTQTVQDALASFNNNSNHIQNAYKALYSK